MRCSKCGSYVEKGQMRCPLCGTVVDVSEDVESIQAEIGNKIDLFLNDKLENLKEIDDGIELKDGQMDVAATRQISHTRTLRQDDSDTVFTYDAGAAFQANAAREAREQAVRTAQQAQPEEARVTVSREEYARAEYEKELARRERAKERESYQKSKQNPQATSSPAVRRRKKSSKAGLIIGIVAGVVVIAAAIALIVILNGRDGKIENPVPETETETTVQADTISCNVTDGEICTVPLEITLSSAQGNRIYYTLDGKAPSVSSNKYVTPIKFDEDDIDGESINYTLRAVTYTSGSVMAGELKITFSLKLEDVEEPVFSLASGNYTSFRTITMSAGKGCTIYYTYDGTDPTTESDVYTTSITMKRGNNVIKAIAVRGDQVSSVASAVYNLDIPAVFTYDQVKEFLKSYLLKYDIEVTDGQVETTGETESESAATEETTAAAKTFAGLTSAGTQVVEENQYYVIKCDIYGSDGSVSETRYYGMNDQTGDVCTMNKTDEGYEIAQ